MDTPEEGPGRTCPMPECKGAPKRPGNFCDACWGDMPPYYRDIVEQAKYHKEDEYRSRIRRAVRQIIEVRTNRASILFQRGSGG